MIRLDTPSVAADILPLATLKAHLRVDHATEDTLIATYGAAAVRAMEARLGRSLGPATYKLTLSSVGAAIDIPVANVSAITGMTIVDRDGVVQTVGADDRVLHTGDVLSIVEPAPGVTWPTAGSAWNACELTVTAGYPLGALPADLTAALLITATAIYRGRGDGDIPKGAENLAAPYRTGGWL